jgi:phosphoenolpyruvate carboxylase
MSQQRRNIPIIMATQHPDNAFPQFWSKEGTGFVSVHEELKECVACFQDLEVDEFMWDWEGKYADEAVIDKLFSEHHKYFSDNQVGKDKYLTFRLPNIWQEKGYSLLRALMVILTSEDFACDLKFHKPPLFEVILPMTERADQLMYIHECFAKLAKFKNQNFNDKANLNTEFIEVIPLVEGTESQIAIGELLSEYVDLHKKSTGKYPPYVRPFLARSDPSLISGLIATVLANKIALCAIQEFSTKYSIPTYPIIGAGGLVFRGGLNPNNVDAFIAEYQGVHTVTVQSAFRYDYPKSTVKKALAKLRTGLVNSKAVSIPKDEREILLSIISRATDYYQKTIPKLTTDLDKIFQAVPKHRERRQHIGLLSYGRKMGKSSLPRAISFTAGLYSLGIPPEFIGLGRTLQALTFEEMEILRRYYINLKKDIETAGRFINRSNLANLARKNKAWKMIEQDIKLTEEVLKIKVGPQSKKELIHENLTSNLLLQIENKLVVSRLIVETGKIRQSLG